MADMIPVSSTPNAGLAWSNDFCNRFVLNADAVYGSFKYFKASAGDNTPDYLQLWNLDTNTKLVEKAPVPSGATGWITVAFDTGVLLKANTNYLVGGLGPGTATERGWSTAHPSLDSNFTLIGVRFGGTRNVPSANTSSWELAAVGLSTDGPGPGTGDSSGGTFTGSPTYTGDLEAWESSDSTKNLHQSDGLPWLTKTVADAIQVVTNKLGASGSGNSLDWIASLWRLAGDLTDAEIGLLKSLLTRQGQITGASGGGGSAFYGPSGTQVAEGVETLLAQGITPTDLGAAITLLRERLSLSPDLADTTRWTLVDTISGEADALVNVQADAYFLNLTTIPPGHPQLGIAATLWVPRWGWASPRVHAHFRQRQFTDLFPAVFTTEGLFMDGLLIHALPGFEWTCECYTLDRS